MVHALLTAFTSTNRGSTVLPVVRAEHLTRPARGISRRIRGLADGANFDLAPNRLRSLLEMSRRITGARQLATDVHIAQIQARF